MPDGYSFSNSSAGPRPGPEEVFLEDEFVCTVADFIIDGKRYIVCGEELSAKEKACQKRSSADESAIVGELTIKQNRYAVIEDGNGRQTLPDKNTLKGLTGREIQVLLLVAEGLVNKEIAAKLKISEWTVSTHLRRIFAKLNVKSRAEMVYSCSRFLCNVRKSKKGVIG